MGKIKNILTAIAISVLTLGAMVAFSVISLLSGYLAIPIILGVLIYMELSYKDEENHENQQ